MCELYLSKNYNLYGVYFKASLDTEVSYMIACLFENILHVLMEMLS